MSIKVRLILGCLVFAGLTIAFGLLSFRGQLDAVDRLSAFVDSGVDPLTRLQTSLGNLGEVRSRLESEIQIDGDAARRMALGGRDLQSVLSAVADVRENVAAVLETNIPETAKDSLRGLVYSLGLIETGYASVSKPTVARELEKITLGLQSALRILRNDLDERGEAADEAMESSKTQGAVALGTVLFAMLGLVIYLIRSVSTPFRRMSETARALLANEEIEIKPIGPKEVREATAAIAELQDRCQFLKTDLDAKTNMLSDKIEAQQGQLQAALDNMTQALCMLDGQRRLLLSNGVFNERFGEFDILTPAKKFFSDPSLTSALRENETDSIQMTMPDGIVLEVKRRGMVAKGLLITFEDITQRELISKRLKHLAGHDQLTDLPNRRQFGEDLDALLKTARKPFAVVVVDLRNFKSINDNYGHPIGDLLLKACGDRLAGLGDGRSRVARLGGDEFAIITPQTKTAPDVEALGKAIVSSFNEPFEIEDRRMFATVSVGIVVHDPSAVERDGINADIMLQNCDLALYKAKEDRSGIGSCEVFEPAMRARLKERCEMEVDLKAALDAEEFELYYQPFVDMAEKRVSGFEALLRWRHPEKGMISPADFIPLAEESGLIDRLGIWCLNTACAEAATWPETMTISVNLSPMQFKSDTLLADIDNALKTSGLAANRLQIEVTESLFLDQSDRILDILKEMRSRGLTVSMDDFGTGYSSLGYLSRFSFNKIKIDQSFVRDLGRQENIAIVRSVIGLSKSLKMQVIAEGIETEQQMRGLLAEGCREMQGYFFSKPQPKEELPRMIAEITKRWTGDLGASADAALAA
ncbi:putative bifunctional diguanylate cyclase/phosphodiesterase [Jiella mangrovi]|uniref:EAL domain-containing protein n=1 Tax=Jiella mangrovi TaxID=2821407 RepID=A0ABS4BCJ3_9HYPH|nr:EAL domain-containing protein [Jiella mangrovi]MBP0614460.1 EAL domain-containing protein [Jiella mangrovi]